MISPILINILIPFLFNKIDTPSIESQPYSSIGYYYYQETKEKNDFNDMIIVLSQKGDEKFGLMYGNSDQFDSGREAYLPGFFVLEMKELKIWEDSISFYIDSKGSQFYSKPIDIECSSTEDVLSKGYHKWIQDMRFFEKRVAYKGILLPHGMLIRNLNSNYFSEHPLYFQKISKKRAKSKKLRTIDKNAEETNRKYESATY